jgi:phage terminase large subunit
MLRAERLRRTTKKPVASDIIKRNVPRAFWPLAETRSRYKGFYGGRGSAKTHSFATALVIRASLEPMRVLCCREFQRSIKESVKHTLDGKIAHLGLIDKYESTQTELRTSVGSQFIFEGLRTNPLSIQSYEGITHVWVEEASTVSQTSLDILIPTIRKPGSELWFSWNPRNATDPVDRMFRQDVAEIEDSYRAGYDRWMVAHRVSWEDNEFFPDVLRGEMDRDKRRDPDKYAHIWLGEYQKISSARVFRNWKIATLEVPDNAVPYFGADWGFSVDPTVLVRCYVLGDRVMYVDAEISQVGCPIDKTPELFDQLDGGMARYWPIRADSSRPETIQYMETHGYRKIIPARKGPGSVEEGVQFLQNFDIVVHPNCKRVIDELTLYSYEVDKLTNDVLPKLADMDNHTIDALRYAVEDVRRAAKVVKPIVVTSPLSINYG